MKVPEALQKKRFCSILLLGVGGQKMRELGAEDITATQDRDELITPLEESWGNNPAMIEMRVTATASGSPCRHLASIIYSGS